MKSSEMELLNVLYKSRQIDGRTQLCPRIGIYKIKSINPDGWACRKRATLATCKWKPYLTSEFHSDFEVVIQLQSLALNCNVDQFLTLKSDNLVDKVIHISYANYDKSHQAFFLKWDFINT